MNESELTPGNHSTGKLDQCHIVGGFLFIANQKFTEAVEERVSHLDNPAACAKVRVAIQLFLLLTTGPDMWNIIALFNRISAAGTRNMRLVINEDKTKIYDLTKERMKYLGYDFYAFKQNTKDVKKKGKLMVANTLPQVKANEIVGKCRDLLRAIRQNLFWRHSTPVKTDFLGDGTVPGEKTAIIVLEVCPS